MSTENFAADATRASSRQPNARHEEADWQLFLHGVARATVQEPVDSISQLLPEHHNVMNLFDQSQTTAGQAGWLVGKAIDYGLVLAGLRFLGGSADQSIAFAGRDGAIAGGLVGGLTPSNQGFSAPERLRNVLVGSAAGFGEGMLRTSLDLSLNAAKARLAPEVMLFNDSGPATSAAMSRLNSPMIRVGFENWPAPPKDPMVLQKLSTATPDRAAYLKTLASEIADPPTGISSSLPKYD